MSTGEHGMRFPAGAEVPAFAMQLHGGLLTEVAATSLHATLAELGFEETDAARLGDAVAGACRAIIERAFDRPDEATVGVELFVGPTGARIRITDDGMPFTIEESDQRAELAGALTASPVEHVRVDRNADGHVVELLLRRDPSGLTHLAAAGDVGTEAVPIGETITVRPLERGDCASLARCVWRAYRYTYMGDYLYEPDRVWELIEQGRLQSFVAVDDTGEVVGHAGLIFPESDHRVADIGLMLVDPRYRAHHLLGRISQAMLGAIVELGLVGVFAETVTTHTITQRAMVEAGAVETGVQLGLVPSSVNYRGIDEDLGGKRQSAVLSYSPVGAAPTRPVALPHRYADELRRAYRALGLQRPEVPAVTPSGSSELRVDIAPPSGLATLVVHRVGDDLARVVARHRRDLCATGIQIVHVELPLSDPATAGVTDLLHQQGFLYGGCIPELRDGDVLRLQYLDVEVDTDIILLYTDEARRLLQLTLADQG
jgi:serine/threonine-protein kinase RsbW